ncbi:MAG: DNA recombination protein RmuC [Candidatus Cloacimonetes bacterium]|nr:DNA recombination protein RmuC [Candidatus Cloacimonadota bacterium]
MELLYLAVGMLIGGVIIGLFFFGKKGKQDENIKLFKSELEKADSELSNEREKHTNSLAEIARLETININIQEKLNDQKKELEELQEKFTDAFKNLANEILEEKTKKFTEQNKANLDELLNPLKSDIEKFKEKIENTDEKNRISNATLIQQIEHLKDLNKKISDDANNLTKALKGDVKIQGNWGEIILERILEESGLRKGIEFETQVSLTDDDGHRKQLDVKINLPEEKHVIIDSKVSLVHYERMVSSETEEQRKGYLKALNASIKSQIDDLHKKHYHDLKGLNSPDFVMMFIPIEGVFATIMQHDNTIYQYAYNKQIVIVSPSTLLATLRTIAFIWRQENQTKNAMEIARQGGALLDKFNGFIDDLEKIDVNLKRTQAAYDDAVKKLSTGSGNLISRAKRIEALGAKAKKQIPEKFINEETLIE